MDLRLQDLEGKDFDVLALAYRYGAEWAGDPIGLAHKVLYELAPSPTVRIDVLERATAICALALEMLAKAKPYEPSPWDARDPAPAAQPEPDPTPAPFSWPDNPIQAGRLRKVLAHTYSFSGEVAALGEYLAAHELTSRWHYVRHYARHKRDGCNAKLQTPKHEYTIHYRNGNGCDWGIDVPKIVYDALPHLPDRYSEEAHF